MKRLDGCDDACDRLALSRDRDKALLLLLHDLLLVGRDRALLERSRDKDGYRVLGVRLLDQREHASTLGSGQQGPELLGDGLELDDKLGGLLRDNGEDLGAGGSDGGGVAGDADGD